jgi:hypothetical protein
MNVDPLQTQRQLLSSHPGHADDCKKGQNQQGNSLFHFFPRLKDADAKYP